MQLPIIFPSISGQQFGCRGCTRCCRELVVHLTRGDREKIDRQKWGGRIEGEPYIRLGRNYVLSHRAAGGCIFLADDGRCRIHAEFGPTEKPLACQLYPFTLERAGDGVYASIRLDCPTAARSDGPPIATHKSDVKRLTDEAIEQGVIAVGGGASTVELGQGTRIGVRAVDRLIERLDRWVSAPSQPIEKRLGGLCELVRTLNAAKLARMDEESAGDLADLLAGGLPELAAEHASKQLAPPTARQLSLFRQSVYSHTEQATFKQIVAPLMQAMRMRWDQLRRARRMSGGSGATPALRGIEGSAEFAAVDRVTGSAADFGAVVGRYLSSRIQGRTVFGGGYYGWSIVDGLSALVLSTACAGWLARCAAAARGSEQFTREDVELAVGIVDRAGGRAPELGAKSAKLRLRYLSEDDGVARLVRRYGVG